MKRFEEEFAYSENQQDQAVLDYYHIVLEAAAVAARFKPGRPATVVELEVDEEMGPVIIALDLKRCPANVQKATARLIELLKEGDE
jgi:hypothetical protein